MRRTAKMVNFGIIYGISAFGLSQRLGSSPAAEARIIDELLPAISRRESELHGDTIAEAQRNGLRRNLTGRRRYLRDINSGNGTIRSAAERTAINTPIQGTAADMIKIAMVRVDEVARGEAYRNAHAPAGARRTRLRPPREEQDELVPKIEEAMRECPAPHRARRRGVGNGGELARGALRGGFQSES
jgi:DNA polymerase-1